MKIIKKIIKTSTLLAVCGLFLLSNPINSFAWGCDYTQYVHDNYADTDYAVRYRLDVMSDNVYVFVETDASLVTVEDIHYVGTIDGVYTDEINFTDYEGKGPLRRELFYYHGDTHSDWTWVGDYYGHSLEPIKARSFYSLCCTGNWTATSTYWQAP